VSRYLLDTNVVSEVRKPKRHGAVVAWLSGLRDEQLFVSAATFGELQAGAERTRLQDPAKATQIELWADGLPDLCQVLPMDALCFREWARLMSGKPADLAGDAMIAATARVHDLIVATRNERDFKHFKVDVVNPFKTGG
jgi:predicted nucleic acid-binding protein